MVDIVGRDGGKDIRKESESKDNSDEKKFFHEKKDDSKKKGDGGNGGVVFTIAFFVWSSRSSPTDRGFCR